jgi:hypothetical protein
MRMWTGVAGRLISQWMIVAGFSLFTNLTNVQAQATPQATQEIKGLLDFVEHSECQFVRNGDEFPGPRARAHLEKKLNYLEGKNMVNSAEDFIDLAATRSSMSGRAYEVRCPEGAESARTWLMRELQRQRQLH